jgi:hypothetical protein
MSRAGWMARRHTAVSEGSCEWDREALPQEQSGGSADYADYADEGQFTRGSADYADYADEGQFGWLVTKPQLR